MKSTQQALDDGFEVRMIEGLPLYSFKFGDGYELCFEPLLWGKMYVGLYQNEELLTEKVVMQPVTKQEDSE